MQPRQRANDFESIALTVAINNGATSGGVDFD